MRVITFVISLMLIIAAANLVAADAPVPVTCDILQHKLGRLYFSAGEEARVYPRAPFAVCNLKGEDTLLTGYIERSWPGISMSFPVDTEFSVEPAESVIVLIQPARIDSHSTVTIGTDINKLRLFAEDSANSRLIMKRYQHRDIMAQDLAAGAIDGCLSFEKPEAAPDQMTTTEHLLPYVAALVPNVGRDCNDQGRLTTSLYYRFDHNRSPLFFEGHTIPQMTLRPLPQAARGIDNHQLETRPYPLDPERGRRLIESLPHPPVRIRLYVGSSDLNRLGHYFGDILARDRFGIDLTDNKRSADLFLLFVPVSDRIPSTTIYALQHQLVTDSVAGGSANENLRIGAGFADLIERAQNEQDYYSYLDRMSRLMINDLGVFPLFRPTTYFCSGQTLQGVRFNDDGLLDVSAAVKVVLPESAEVTP